MKTILRRAFVDIAARVDPSRLAAHFAYESETCNDRWIAEYVFPGKRNGYFLEAGAADGRGGSSCYVLETQLGWTGICVEPNDDFFERLVHTRSNSIHENVCLAARPGAVQFVEGCGDPAHPYLSGITEHLQHKKGGSEVIASGRLVQKSALPLADILDKHCAPLVIDYGAFDIEGSELEVLQAFPFHRYSFRALSVECDESICDSLGDSLRTLLGGAGYRQVRNPFNLKHAPWERYWFHRDTR